MTHTDRKLLSVAVLLAVFLCASSAFANKNKRKAEAYCRSRRSQSVECKVSAWRGCGVGWKSAKAFRGRGKDYFACVKRAPKLSAEQRCEQLWRSGTSCRVKSGSGCGLGWRAESTFRPGGRNHSACILYDKKWGTRKKRETQYNIKTVDPSKPKIVMVFFNGFTQPANSDRTIPETLAKLFGNRIVLQSLTYHRASKKAARLFIRRYHKPGDGLVVGGFSLGAEATREFLKKGGGDARVDRTANLAILVDKVGARKPSPERSKYWLHYHQTAIGLDGGRSGLQGDRGANVNCENLFGVPLKHWGKAFRDKGKEIDDYMPLAQLIARNIAAVTGIVPSNIRRLPSPKKVADYMPGPLILK